MTRRLPAAGPPLLAVLVGVMLSVVPGAPAGAQDGSRQGVVTLPSPLAGTVNAVKIALQHSGCNLDDQSVRDVQTSDGFALDLGGAPVTVDLEPTAPVGSPPLLPDLDVYFFDAGCDPVGSISTPDVGEQCGTAGTDPCPATARFAVVTMTAGFDADFTFAWSVA